MSCLGESRRLAEAHEHENVVEGVKATRHHHVRSASGQFHLGQVNCPQRTCTSGIHHTVCPAQVKTIGDPPSGHVTQKTWERIFLPCAVVFADASDHFFSGFGIHAAVSQRLTPDWVAQTSTQRNDHFQGTGHAQNHRSAVAVESLPSRAITRVCQSIASHHQAQQLGGVDGFEIFRSDPKIERSEVDGVKKRPPLAVGHVRRFGIRIEVFGCAPVSHRNFANRVAAFEDIRPETGRRIGLREQTSHPHNGDWNIA